MVSTVAVDIKLKLTVRESQPSVTSAVKSYCAIAANGNANTKMIIY